MFYARPQLPRCHAERKLQRFLPAPPSADEPKQFGHESIFPNPPPARLRLWKLSPFRTAGVEGDSKHCVQHVICKLACGDMNVSVWPYVRQRMAICRLAYGHMQLSVWPYADYPMAICKLAYGHMQVCVYDRMRVRLFVSEAYLLWRLKRLGSGNLPGLFECLRILLA